MASVREELESAWAPRDMVMAVIRDTSRSEGAWRDLRESGFEERDLAVFRGEEAAEHLDIEGKRTMGRFTRPLRAFWSYFSIEEPELRAYEQAGEAGHDIVAVRATTDDRVAVAHRILSAAGASNIRRFTRWNVADLPDDQPGAA